MSKNCDLPLHGITVVVETPGNRLYIGRYHSENEEGILLNDADVRDFESAGELTTHLARSAKFGVFKNTDHVKVPRAEIRSVRRLLDCVAGESVSPSNEVS